MDTGRVAATGHSLGGAAALQAVRNDHRFAAVIDLDGYPHGPDSHSRRPSPGESTRATCPASPKCSNAAPRRATGSPSPARPTSPSPTAPCTCRRCPR
ncbi:hypothetical protein [Amycolatopsis alba]|uniref:alpha/beta hydrolase n=1 Tax=Amycolatopsis alba TaxID=76020 RepID=UPI001FD7D42F|nr:hypothetical protein [Amycolatopsis alba]